MRATKMGKKDIVKFAVFIAIILAIIFFAVKYAPWFIANIKDPEALRAYLLAFGGWGVLVFILIVAVQVVAMIPGDIFSIGGGFIYGIPLGTLLSYSGIMLGMVMAFFISRFFGYAFIKNFIAKEKIDKISHLLNSTKGTVGLLIIFLAPFIPKDVLIYVAGLTPIKPLRFIAIYGISRLPGSLMLASTGAFAYSGNISGLIFILILLAALITAAVILYRKHIHKKEDGSKKEKED